MYFSKAVNVNDSAHFMVTASQRDLKKKILITIFSKIAKEQNI